MTEKRYDIRATIQIEKKIIAPNRHDANLKFNKLVKKLMKKSGVKIISWRDG